LKENIRFAGRRRDGLGVYTFAYKGNPAQRYMGVLAHEVAALYPEAVAVDPVSGYQAVDYGALGMELRRVA
jgi:hypothetical protein